MKDPHTYAIGLGQCLLSHFDTYAMLRKVESVLFNNHPLIHSQDLNETNLLHGIVFAVLYVSRRLLSKIVSTFYNIVYVSKCDHVSVTSIAYQKFRSQASLVNKKSQLISY